MANPDLISGFDINDTNTDTIPDTLIDNGYSELQVVESKHYNEMFKQLFAAANKNRNDGVWEWEDPSLNDTEYNIGSIIRYSGGIYVSLVDLNTVTPIDNGSDWYKIDLGNYVKLIGNQTIDDIKTFSSSPIVPTPTTDFQAATKKYVNDNAVSLATANSYDLGVNQTWQDVAASRSSGVTYTNTTGKPIFVVVSGNGSSSGSVVINGITIQSVTTNIFSCPPFIVPDSSTYTVTWGFLKWSELR